MCKVSRRSSGVRGCTHRRGANFRVRRPDKDEKSAVVRAVAAVQEARLHRRWFSGVKVLYVNHTEHVSGAERSLLEVLRGVSPSVTPLVASPDGPLARLVIGAGIEHVVIPGTDGSLRLHPRHTPAALLAMGRAALAVRRLARENHVELVHANSIRAGLITVLARRLGAPPTIVHLRDRLPDSRAARLTLRAIAHADGLIANSRYTARSLDEAGAAHQARVLGNPVDLVRFDPDRVDHGAARAALELAASDFVVAVLAQITPWKGQEEAIRAVARVRDRHPDVKLLLVGTAKFVSRATRYDNRAYLQKLHDLVTKLDLQGDVRFVGEREDIPAVLAATDTLLVPSWEEPFGRTVVEAMAMRVPVVATNVGGPAEVITDGHDGLLLAPRKPQAWAEAIASLIERPELRERLRENGWTRSRAFSVQSHAAALLDIYMDVLERRTGRLRAQEQNAVASLAGSR
jgi:glycosyltransferase involved in cell wall biosynthesis